MWAVHCGGTRGVVLVEWSVCAGPSHKHVILSTTLQGRGWLPCPDEEAEAYCKLTQLKPGTTPSTPGKAVALGSVWQTWTPCSSSAVL